MTKDEIKAAPERSSAGSARLVYQVDCKCVAGCTKCDQLGYTLIPTPAQCAVTRDALDALLAFRHGDTKHLTQEHARILYAALAAQPPAAPVETCQHEAIIGLDGKWHCQKCAAAIEIATAQNSPAHSSADTVDLTNHHNALKCPYCNPKGLQFAEKLYAAAMESADEKLPCDVHLPPVTIIRKGCSYNTLMLAIAQRSNWEPTETVFRDRPTEVSDDLPQAAAVQEALQLAVNIIMDGEPGDSRAVSNEAVALAAVSVGDTSAPVMKVIRDALSRPQSK